MADSRGVIDAPSTIESRDSKSEKSKKRKKKKKNKTADVAAAIISSSLNQAVDEAILEEASLPQEEQIASNLASIQALRNLYNKFNLQSEKGQKAFLKQDKSLIDTFKIQFSSLLRIMNYTEKWNLGDMLFVLRFYLLIEKLCTREFKANLDDLPRQLRQSDPTFSLLPNSEARKTRCILYLNDLFVESITKSPFKSLQHLSVMLQLYLCDDITAEHITEFDLCAVTTIYKRIAALQRILFDNLKRKPCPHPSEQSIQSTIFQLSFLIWFADVARNIIARTPRKSFASLVDSKEIFISLRKILDDELFMQEKSEEKTKTATKKNCSKELTELRDIYKNKFEPEEKIEYKSLRQNAHLLGLVRMYLHFIFSSGEEFSLKDTLFLMRLYLLTEKIRVLDHRGRYETKELEELRLKCKMKTDEDNFNSEVFERIDIIRKRALKLNETDTLLSIELFNIVIAYSKVEHTQKFNLNDFYLAYFLSERALNYDHYVSVNNNKEFLKDDDNVRQLIQISEAGMTGNAFNLWFIKVLQDFNWHQDKAFAENHGRMKNLINGAEYLKDVLQVHEKIFEEVSSWNLSSTPESNAFKPGLKVSSESSIQSPKVKVKSPAKTPKTKEQLAEERELQQKQKQANQEEDRERQKATEEYQLAQQEALKKKEESKKAKRQRKKEKEKEKKEKIREEREQESQIIPNEVIVEIKPEMSEEERQEKVSAEAQAKEAIFLEQLATSRLRPIASITTDTKIPEQQLKIIECLEALDLYMSKRIPHTNYAIVGSFLLYLMGIVESINDIDLRFFVAKKPRDEKARASDEKLTFPEFDLNGRMVKVDGSIFELDPDILQESKSLGEEHEKERIKYYEDARQRDFTLNSVYLDRETIFQIIASLKKPLQGTADEIRQAIKKIIIEKIPDYLDPTGYGREDFLKPNPCIRTVSEAFESPARARQAAINSMTYDPKRIIRLAMMVARNPKLVLSPILQEAMQQVLRFHFNSFEKNMLQTWVSGEKDGDRQKEFDATKIANYLCEKVKGPKAFDILGMLCEWGVMRSMLGDFAFLAEIDPKNRNINKIGQATYPLIRKDYADYLQEVAEPNFAKYCARIWYMLTTPQVAGLKPRRLYKSEDFAKNPILSVIAKMDDFQAELKALQSTVAVSVSLSSSSGRYSPTMFNKADDSEPNLAESHLTKPRA